MVLSSAETENAAKPITPRAAAATDKSRCSSKSRTSRTSRGSAKKREWQCCPCPLTLSSSSARTPRTQSGPKGSRRGAWPAPAKFYCCRADLVADMARERSRQDNNNDSNNKEMQGHDNDVDLDDEEFAFDELAEEALPDDTFREVFDRSHLDDPDQRWEIREPDVPYVENLPHPLDVGRAIVVEGSVLPDAVGFAVNLTCGPGTTPDIAFHLNPRLDRCYVARNSRTKGHWGLEEGAALGGSPFKCGQTFLIHILVTATGFKVSVNRMHFCNYQYRMPLSKICRLEIHGDVVIASIKHTRLEVYPERPLEALPDHTFLTIPTDYAVPWETSISNKENLFIGRFKPNLASGMEITVKGRVKLLPQSFYFNLQQGCQLWPHPNIHLHLNPRFAAEDSEHVVVINGWIRGSWGNEQRYNRCRFRPGEEFSIIIYVEEQRYRIMVNGLQQGAMFHRAPPSQVDSLIVRGDVFVNHVGIAKSAPPAQRMESPSSTYTSSFCESLVEFPTGINSYPHRSSETRSLASSQVSPSTQSPITEDSCQNINNFSSSFVSEIEQRPVKSTSTSSNFENASEEKHVEFHKSDSLPTVLDQCEVSPQEEESRSVTFNESPGAASGSNC